MESFCPIFDSSYGFPPLLSWDVCRECCNETRSHMGTTDTRDILNAGGTDEVEIEFG